MKKVSALILALTMCTAMLTACGGGSSTTTTSSTRTHHFRCYL